MSRDRRVAIVGAGLSGLAAGVMLARRGLAVRVFEAREKAGGCCSSTLIEGYWFHDGALSLGLPQLLDAGFARLGLDRERLLPLHKIVDGYTAEFEDGRSVRMAGGRVCVTSATDRPVVWPQRRR